MVGKINDLIKIGVFPCDIQVALKDFLICTNKNVACNSVKY